MNCDELSNEVLHGIIMAKAGDAISFEFNLTAEMLEKYADVLNWKKVSQNDKIHWTVSLVEKWENRLDWEELSACNNEYLLTPDIIGRFENRWNWWTLSRNHSLNLDFRFIDQFVDRWDWGELMNNWNLSGLYTQGFYSRYREHIPMNEFLNDSQLLREMVGIVIADMMK